MLRVTSDDELAGSSMTAAFDTPEPQPWCLIDQLRGWRGAVNPEDLVAVFSGLLYSSLTSAGQRSAAGHDVGPWGLSEAELAMPETIAEVAWLELADDQLIEP